MKIILIILLTSVICFGQSYKHSEKYVLLNDSTLIIQNELEEVYVKNILIASNDSTVIVNRIDLITDESKKEKLLRKIRTGE